MPQQEGEGGAPAEEGLPPKASGPRPGGGPGGGPGGQVGGGFLSFAGVRPQVFSGLTGFGQPGLPIIKRRRGLPAVPGVTPGAPGRGDTVPAMLSPGEIVMNRGVTQDPENAAALLGMNQEALGFNEGGMVPPAEGFGGGRPSRALRLLQLLLQLDEEDNGGEAGVAGFALGGMAGFPGQMGGRQPSLGMMGGRSPFAANANRPGAQLPVAAPPPPGGFQYNRDSEGNATNFNPGDPFGAYGASQNPYGLGLLYRGIGVAGQAGAFDPRGNQQLLSSQLESARGDADALVRRQMSQADLGGLDPAQRAVAKLQALRETGRGVQEIGANVRANAADRAQSFNEGLYNQSVGGSLGYTLNEQQARNQRIAEQNARANQNKNWWQGVAGNVAGAATGALLPGVKP